MFRIIINIAVLLLMTMLTCLASMIRHGSHPALLKWIFALVVGANAF